MKALCVLESVSRADGGIFEAERALQCALAEREGVDVRVVGVRDDFTEADAAKWGSLRPRVAALRGPAGFGYAPGIGDLLDVDVDLAYAATLWKYPSWAVLNWQKKTRKPVVAAPHGSLDAWALNNSRWKKRVAAWLFKDEQLRRATCFRALCAAEADAIRAYGLRQRIEVVPNGVELVDLLTTEHTEGTEGRRMLLFLGRIHPKKGLVGALRAWADIQNSKSKIQNSKQWQFVIAGWDQGGHEGELRALCADLGLKTAVGTTKDTNIHENIRPRITRMGTDEQQGDAQVTCAGDSEPDSLTSKLADSPVSESLTRSASGPASLPATSYSLLATAPEALTTPSAWFGFRLRAYEAWRDLEKFFPNGEDELKNELQAIWKRNWFSGFGFQVLGFVFRKLGGLKFRMIGYREQASFRCANFFALG